MCSHCNGGNYDMEPSAEDFFKACDEALDAFEDRTAHSFVGVKMREKEVVTSDYAAMSIEYRVWVCSCGSEFRDLREFKEHKEEA